MIRAKRPQMDTRNTFAVGCWTINPSDGTVARDGRVERLEPKVMAVLLFLAERQGSLVTHDELLRGVWPDVHVAPSALARTISILRRTLGDDVRQPTYIETVPKRDCRFVVPVVAAPPPPRVVPTRRLTMVNRLALAAALVVSALIASGGRTRQAQRDASPGPLI